MFVWTDISQVQYKNNMKPIRASNEQGMVKHPRNLELSKLLQFYVSHSSLREECAASAWLVSGELDSFLNLAVDVLHSFRMFTTKGWFT